MPFHKPKKPFNLLFLIVFLISFSLASLSFLWVPSVNANSNETPQPFPNGYTWTFRYSDDGNTLYVHALSGASQADFKFLYVGGRQAYQLDESNLDLEKKFLTVNSDASDTSNLKQFPDPIMGHACPDQNDINIFSFTPSGSTSLEDAYKAIIRNGNLDAASQHKILNIKRSPHAFLVCTNSQIQRTGDHLGYIPRTVNAANAVDPGAVGVGGGALGWTDYSGADLRAGSGAFSSERFRFLSPFLIMDLSTTLPDGSHLRYQTISNNDYHAITTPEGYTINDGNKVLLNNGIFLLRPVDQTGKFIERSPTNNACMGFFSVKTPDSGEYGTPYYVPTKDVSGTCEFGTDYSVTDFPAFIGGGDRGNESLKSNPINLGGPFDQGRRLFFATFAWQDPNTIVPAVQDSGGSKLTLSKMTIDPNITKTLNLGPGNWQFWSTQSCQSSSHFPSMLVINYDATPTQTDWNNTISPNVNALVFTPKGDGSGWTANWNGDSLKCLIGHEIKENAASLYKSGAFQTLYQTTFSNQDSSQDNIAFVAFPGKSVGNTAGSITDATQTLTDQNSSTTLKRPKCDVSINPLTWLICPIYTGAITAVDQFDKAIMNVLTINVDHYFNPDAPACKNDPKCPAPAVFRAWSAVRDIAMGILVLAGLVMVIAQALNFGPLDAYTVKKVLPRIVIAVIVIAISWPLLQAAIDLSNGLGTGVRSLIEAPFTKLPSTHINATTSSASVLLGGAAIFGLGPLGLLSFALTGLLAVIIGFATVVFREMLVILLVILAPFAIACYVLPNTHKAWKFWYDSFLGALLAFPIITSFIAIGRVFSAIAYTDGTNLLQQTIAVAAYFAPYFLLPAAFKLASGVLSTVSGAMNDRSRGPFDSLKKYRQQSGAAHRERLGRRVLGRRADWQNRLQEQASMNRYGALGRFGLRTLARGVGGYNIQAADAARRAAVGKELNDQIATGRDDEIRGLTVNRDWALRHGVEGQDWRVGENGVRQFKSLGGAWVNEGAVIEGHRRWGRDSYAQQTALSYEMRKAGTEEETANIASNYHNLQDAWHATDNQMQGSWIGASFENQNQHLEFKQTNWKNGDIVDRDASGRITGINSRAQKFVSEIYEKKGSYPLAQMGSHTIVKLKDAYAAAQRSGDVDTQNRIKAIADTFMTEMSTRPIGDAAAPDALLPEGATGRRQANTPGAAHVAERVRELAEMTGVYSTGPTGRHTPGADNTYGQIGRNRREQN